MLSGGYFLIAIPDCQILASYFHFVVSCKLGQTWKLCKLWRGRLGTLKCERTHQGEGKQNGTREEARCWYIVDVEKKNAQGFDLKNAFDAICYTLPRTLRQSQKINNSLWLSHLFGSCCFSSFAHAVTLGAFFVSLSLQITRLLEDSGTVFMSTCWRLGSCQTRLTQRLARPTMTPSRYSVVTYAAKLKYRLFSFMKNHILHADESEL